MAIDKIGHYSITNSASVYDEEALTALELAGRTAGKVNECIEAFNHLEDDTNRHLEEQDKQIPVQVEQAVDRHIEDGDFDEAIDKYAGELTDRLNNLVANAGDDNTEIVDARLGADGYAYETLGDAIRTQLSEVVVGTSKKNLIDMNKLTAGYVSTSGDIHPSHQSGTFERWEYTTDFIEVETDIAYFLSIIHDKSVDGWYCIATYDENKQFIDRDRTYNYTGSLLGRKFTFYDEVCYVRISFRSYRTASIKFEQSEYATSDVERQAKANLIDEFPLQFDGYIVDNGSIFPQTAEGYIEGQPALLEKYTRHIPVTAGEVYTVYHKADAYAWACVCMYGTDGRGIQRVTLTEGKNTFTIPDGCESIMVCARTHYLKDFAVFKETSPMTAEQRAYENYVDAQKEPAVTGNTVDYNAGVVKSIAHRGWTKDAPENTLKAFRRAKEMGFKYVECDVRVTSDGQFVLCHDATVDRTSNGTGNVSDMTLAQLKELDFGQGEKIPTLEEFLRLCRGLGLHPYIELKGVGIEGASAIGQLVCDYGLRRDATIISFDFDELDIIREEHGYMRLGLLCNEITTEIQIQVDNLSTDINGAFINVSYANLQAEALHSTYKIEVWTVWDENDVVNLPPLVTGVTADNVHAGKVLYEHYSKG